MKKYFLFATGMVIFGVVLLASPSAFAQGEDQATSSPETQVPTALGEFLRDFGERINLLFTFDLVKKANKQITFAEVRVDIAERILEESDSERAHAFAERMIGRSTELIEKAVERKNRWIEQEESRRQALLDRITRHEARRQALLDQLELGVTEENEDEDEEKVENFFEFRENVSERSRGLLGAIENENIPDDVQERLETVRERINEHAQETMQFREDLLELLNPDEGEVDTEALRALLMERREVVGNRVKRENKRQMWIPVEETSDKE